MASTGSQTGISIWDIPLSTANLIYGIAYIALIIGSILTAVATISLSYSSAIRDRYADASISHAKKDAAEALEHAIAQDAENLKIK